MLRNAPHLVHDLQFVVPAYNYLSLPYYGFGLKVYERLSGKLSLGRSQLLSRKSTLEILSGLREEGLRGAFSITTVSLTMRATRSRCLRTFQDLGGTAINYVEAVGLLHTMARPSASKRVTANRIAFSICRPRWLSTPAKFCRGDPWPRWAAGEPLLVVSQGTHIVLPKSFLPGKPRS